MGATVPPRPTIAPSLGGRATVGITQGVKGGIVLAGK